MKILQETASGNNQENNQYDKLFKRCWSASIVCFIVSFILPVYSTEVYEINCGQGIWMFLFGWLTLGWSSLFYVWLANPLYNILQIYLIFKVAIRKPFVSSITSRMIAYIAVICGLLFCVKGYMILDEGGSEHAIIAYHIGYWLWEISFVLTAFALMAKGKEGTIVRRIVDGYLRLTGRVHIAIKIVTFVLVAICYECFAIHLSVCDSDHDPVCHLSVIGPYKSCERIRLTFYDDEKVEATISSTDFVGRGKRKIQGTYRYEEPYVFVDWDEQIDMKFLQYDSLSRRIIMYEEEDVYFLDPPKIVDDSMFKDELSTTRHSLVFNDRVVMPENDYYIVGQDTLIHGYGTDAQQLRLPAGYHLTYDQIYQRQIKKIGLDKDGNLPILYEQENKVLNYEDDSLQIVFSHLTFLTTGLNKPLGLMDYSAIPLVVYDKRKKR